MIGLDTNVLARYYIEDHSDPEASRQRIAARRLIESGQALMVCKTVILEFEWILRGYYRFSSTEVIAVMRHLLGLAHLTVEDKETVEYAVSHCKAGLDFADALHHASYRTCDAMASFDDKKFVRRTRRLGLAPTVSIPT
jgi:predicted nucleic-acid-binding protein